MSQDLDILTKKQGTYILNTAGVAFTAQQFDVIKVVAATRLALTDTNGRTEEDYISNPALTVPAGTEIRPFEGGKFHSVTIIGGGGGAVEITI